MEAYVKASDLERLNIRLGRRLMGKEKAAIRASFAISRAFIPLCPLQGIDAMSSAFVMPEIAYNDPALNENDLLQRKYNLWSTTYK